MQFWGHPHLFVVHKCASAVLKSFAVVCHKINTFFIILSLTRPQWLKLSLKGGVQLHHDNEVTASLLRETPLKSMKQRRRCSSVFVEGKQKDDEVMTSLFFFHMKNINFFKLLFCCSFLHSMFSCYSFFISSRGLLMSGHQCMVHLTCMIATKPRKLMTFYILQAFNYCDCTVAIAFNKSTTIFTNTQRVKK